VGEPVVHQKLTTPAKRLRAAVKVLRKKVRLLDEKVNRLHLLLDDRMFRLARRLARLEGASPAVQCQDGS
jgi:hypothetical protein